MELDESWKKEGNTGQYRVTKKYAESTGRQRNFLKFENTLGLCEEDWIAYIELSSMMKLPLSDNDWEASMSVNNHGEETATLVWNTFGIEKFPHLENLFGSLSLAEEISTVPEEGVAHQPDHLINSFSVDGNSDFPLVECSGRLGDSSEMSAHQIPERYDGKQMSGSEDVDRASPTQMQACSVNQPAGEGPGSSLTCSFCGATGITTTFNLRRHISRMHSGSFKCSICQVEFSDRHNLNLHTRNCYHYCPVVGCSFKEKRKSRLDGHVRMHCRF